MVENNIYRENFYNDWKKIRAIHLTESYVGQDRKYLELPRLKYLVLQKYGTKYQKLGPNTNLIFSIDQWLEKISRQKYLKVPTDTLQSL